VTPPRRGRTGARVGPLVARTEGVPVLDVDALLADRGTRIVVCCGSGGVGKTTTSAALALRAAEQGRRVVVLTIDPARRLAQSMGIETLDNVPRPVPAVDGSSGGSLEAMMLDMKRTFDEVVESGASPEKAAQILANPFYVAVSSSFAGTQEYMAMEKLGQLDAEARRTGAWDLIVVDTPPSRSALDFLDAPERLSSFLDGRLIRLLLMPARGPAKLMTAGVNLVTNALAKVLGGQMLRDVQTFVAALDTLFGGFRQRAQRTYRLLQADGTAFLVVAAPEPDALREAAYFVERLNEERMPLAGLVVNRATAAPRGRLSAEQALVAAERLEEARDDGEWSRQARPPEEEARPPGEEARPPGEEARPPGEEPGPPGEVDPPAAESARLTAALLRLHADRARIVARETRLRRRFSTVHPDVPTAVVPALSVDVHDLDGLRRVGDLLAHTP
jgi:anion-transporting  ArsA/GET3 family ATPase